MKPHRIIMPAAAALILLTGCATLPQVPPEEAAVQQCLVCRHRRDFSCLEVEKTPTTPRAQCDGRTYWFCSENCRCEFEKNPKSFVRRS